jgi:hypothetical protein
MSVMGRTTVRPATRDAIISELERAMISLGAEDFDSGTAKCQRALDWFQRNYHPLRSKKDFATFLDEVPEPSFWRKRMILGVFRHSAHLVRFALTRIATVAEDTLPTNPSGRPGLDAIEKARIVVHVGRRYTAGYALDQAKKSAATKFGVSESTVQRAWDDRGNRAEVDFRTVLRFIEENAKEHSQVLDWIDQQSGTTAADER